MLQFLAFRIAVSSTEIGVLRSCKSPMSKDPKVLMNVLVQNTDNKVQGLCKIWLLGHQLRPYVFMFSVLFQPKTTRITHVLEQVGFSTFAVKQNSHYGELWGVSVRGCLEPIMGFGLWLDNLDRV